MEVTMKKTKVGKGYISTTLTVWEEVKSHSEDPDRSYPYQVRAVVFKGEERGTRSDLGADVKKLFADLDGWDLIHLGEGATVRKDYGSASVVYERYYW